MKTTTRQRLEFLTALILGVSLLAGTFPLQAQDSSEGFRVWRAVSGQRVYARLIGREDELVRLELRDGKRIEIDRMRLSQRDRTYLVNATIHKPTAMPHGPQADETPPLETVDRSNEIQTRTFLVRLDALGLGGADTDRELVRLLSGQGIEFAQGNDLKYDPTKRMLTLVHTGKVLDTIERLLARMNLGSGKATYRIQVYRLSSQKAEKMNRFVEIQARWGERIELNGAMESAIAEFKRIGKAPVLSKLEIAADSGGRFRQTVKAGTGSATVSGTSYVFPGGKKTSLTFSTEIQVPSATSPIAVSATAEPAEGETFIVMTHGESAGTLPDTSKREYYVCEITLVDVAQ